MQKQSGNFLKKSCKGLLNINSKASIMLRNTNKVTCPNCNSKNIIRKGKRKNKFQTIQIYQCKDCKKYFTSENLMHKTYPFKIILKAISLYNLGNTLEETKNIINNKHGLALTPQAISTWLSKYKNLCSFNRLRKYALKICKSDKMIFHSILNHHQIYKYQLHKAKLQLLSNEIPQQKFQLLKKYLEKIPTKEFPNHIFQPKLNKTNELSRSSQTKFQTLDFIKQEKQNTANKLAELALNLAQNNRQRHQEIQDFMLINDSTTIAAEIPVYLTRQDINYFKNKGFQLSLQNHNTPITGHIDLLQIRNKLIHILDYKPEAKKQNPVNQLTLYALALASRTKLALKDFKCAWFDENNYYEFFPLHVVYKLKKNNKKADKTKS